ncbi:MAG TPA: NAD(P)-binding protein, partial [Pseudobdellovibrionaceae bacterium]
MEVRNRKTLIIGTGPAGLGAADYALSQQMDYEILESAPTPFGHCKSFSLPSHPDIWFDEGPHISFTKNKQVQDIFAKSAPDFLNLKPLIENYWRETYIPHPVQANLRSIPEPYLSEIVADIPRRPNIDNPTNYGDWLRTAFGDKFKSLFHEVYTQKYWTVPSQQMTVDWIGERVYRPQAEAMLRTATTEDFKPSSHYITDFRYPRAGGFQSFLKKTMKAHQEKTHFNSKVVQISPSKKQVITDDGRVWNYDVLLSSLPS